MRVGRSNLVYDESGYQAKDSEKKAYEEPSCLVSVFIFYRNRRQNSKCYAVKDKDKEEPEHFVPFIYWLLKFWLLREFNGYQSSI